MPDSAGRSWALALVRPAPARKLPRSDSTENASAYSRDAHSSGATIRVGDRRANIDSVTEDRLADAGTQKILEVGLEGGAVTLEGRRLPRGRWEFRIVQDWGTAWELIDEAPPARQPAPWMSSWEEALAKLDEGPWTQMLPLVVHPEFAERIVAIVLARESEDSRYLHRWRMFEQ